jgi:hypothetical protein
MINNKEFNSNLTSKGMIKRVNKEYNDLKEIYGDKVELDDSNTEIGFNQNRLKLIVKPDKNTLIFTFTDNYPFKSPKMTINGIDAYQCYRISNPILINEYIKISKQKCMCCETLLCPHKWSPSMRLSMIIDEYKTNKKYKKYLRNYKWLLKINQAYKYVFHEDIINYMCKILFKLEHQQH